MKTTQPLKYTLVATTTALLMLSMTVFAAPFTPGQTLDPGCAPGSADCYVSAPSGGSDTDWTQNGAGVWNTTNNIGIGTNSPSSQLTIVDNGIAGSSSVTPVSFTGSGLNDLTTNGVYTGNTTQAFRIEVVSNGTPDELEFFVNNVSQGIFPIPGLTIPIGDGTEILLGSDTGHTIGDYWEFTQVGAGGIFDILGTNNQNLLSVSSTGLSSQFSNSGNGTYSTLGMSDAGAVTINASDAIRFDSRDNVNSTYSTIQLEPTGDVSVNGSGNTNITSEQDISINAGRDISINGTENWYGGVNAYGNTIDPGTRRLDFSFQPYASTPSAGFELKSNQEYASGIFTLHANDKKYSNIFYGELDSNNSITDISRLEAADVGTSGMFIYDLANGYTNDWTLNGNGFTLKTQNNQRLTISNEGIINMPMPTYADDGAAGAGGLVVGDLYKTATGEVRIKL